MLFADAGTIKDASKRIKKPKKAKQTPKSTPMGPKETPSKTVVKNSPKASKTKSAGNESPGKNEQELEPIL